jgi:hypothetical protein
MEWLVGVERILLALIIGGGIVMASCVRPLFLEVLNGESKDSTVILIERISINAWNKYNRIALLSTLIILALELVFIALGWSYTYIHLGIVILMVIALIRKLQVDQKLKNRVKIHDVSNVVSAEQKSGHREVELLSIGILILALLMMIIK